MIACRRVSELCSRDWAPGTRSGRTTSPSTSLRASATTWRAGDAEGLLLLVAARGESSLPLVLLPVPRFPRAGERPGLAAAFACERGVVADGGVGTETGSGSGSGCDAGCTSGSGQGSAAAEAPFSVPCAGSTTSRFPSGNHWTSSGPKSTSAFFLFLLRTVPCRCCVPSPTSCTVRPTLTSLARSVRIRN